jgi:hypothetical protein
MEGGSMSAEDERRRGFASDKPLSIGKLKAIWEHLPKRDKWPFILCLKGPIADQLIHAILADESPS